MNTQDYVSRFLALKCSGDVMNTVAPMGSGTKKEITESMGVIKKLKNLTIKHPMKYTVYDMCAGNALTSVLSVFLLPVKNAIAIDKRPRKRHWENAKRFEYQNKDIYELDPTEIKPNSIIIAVHPCKNLARRIIDIYKESKASHLILMPCCKGKTTPVPYIIKKRIGSYLIWCWQLADKCNGTFVIDNEIISPKNCIITASKKEKI